MSDSKKEAAPAATKPAIAPAGKVLKKVKGAKGKLSRAEKAKVKKAKAEARAKAKADGVVKRPAPKDGDAPKVKKTRRGGVGKRNRNARAARKEERIARKRGAAVSKEGDAPPVKKPRRKHCEIASGVMRFSRPYRYHKRGFWTCAAKRRKVTPKKPRTIRKEIGGDKNGGFRIVLLKKRRQNYPTADPIRKRRTRGVFKKHKRYIRKTLKPGTICILLAGVHKGKRVVLLKVLKTGLLLINGPFKVNGCPLRRVSQNFVIATRTRLNLSDAKIPDHLNDDYFKRIHPKKSKKEEGDIFSTKKEKYVPSEQRKTDQKAMDKIVVDAIKKYGKKGQQVGMLTRYLKTMFGLRRNQKPHYMKF